MGTMWQRSEPAERFCISVETAPGSGAFRVDERLAVEQVHQRCDAAISTARVCVRLDDAFDGEAARRRYHPDRRLLIATDESEAARRTILFDGYPPLQRTRWDGRIGGEQESYVFEAEHVFERLGRSREAMVYGRYVRNGRIEEGLAEDPADFADKAVLMTALPCVFNPDGRGNRAAWPLTVMSPTGGSRRIDIFTHDSGSGGIKWTYATALRYLVWFYLVRGGPVAEGNIFEATEVLVNDEEEGTDVFGRALAREPVSLVCEATNLLEALHLLVRSAGLHVSAETDNVDGSPRTRLRIWSPETGPVRRLFLARGGRRMDGSPWYDASARSASQVLRENNVSRGEVAWDHRAIVNSPVVIGDVKRYEMTVPLWPGWRPRSGLDNVAEPNREVAKAAALTPEQVEALGEGVYDSVWYRLYHRQGNQFKYHTDVARLWVLNEDGAFTGAFYNRHAPFDDYRSFDFSSVAEAVVTTWGTWMRRPRPFRPTISVSTDGRSLGVWVEISFDGGATWQQQSGGVRVLEDRAGIYLECENPCEICPTGEDPAVENMWYALVDRTFRVRVTALLDSDERLIGTFPADALAEATLRTHGQVVYRPRAFRFASRSHTNNALSTVGMGPVERDDSAAIARVAEQLARANQDRQVRVLPAIPWIETGYELGDRISEIRGRQIGFATVTGAGTRWPSVLGRQFILHAGRYETQLTLGLTDLPAEAV